MNFIKFFENFNPILDEIFEYFSDFEDEWGSDVSVYTIDRGIIRVDIKTSNWPEGLSIRDFLDKFKGSLKMIESMGKFKIDPFGYFGPDCDNRFIIQVGIFQSGMDRLQIDRGMGIRQTSISNLSGQSILREYNYKISRGLGRRSGNTQEANLQDIYIHQISFVLNPID
jgi:hypothetical protein